MKKLNVKKPSLKKLSKKAKRILLSVTALILVAAIGVGIWFGTRSSGDPVYVYSFDNVGMTEFWGDTQESYGPVTTDRIQTVFLTDTQTVTEVKVKEGDTVKKGDILLSFDTTLSDLQLERKRLEMEKEKLQLDALNAELTKIKNMKPMTPMEDWGFELPEPPQGTELTQPYKAYIADGYDGQTMGSAFICRLRGDTVIDDTLLETLRRMVWGNTGICEHDVWGETCDICNPPPCIHGNVLEECPICQLKECPHGNVQGMCPDCHSQHGSPVSGCIFCVNDICRHFTSWYDCPICNPVETEPVETKPDETDPDETEKPGEVPDPPTSEPPASEESSGAQPPENIEAAGLSFASGEDFVIRFLANDTPSEDSPIKRFYVIFKITEGNMDLGANILWQGVYVYGQGNDFSLSFFTPTIEDYTLPEEEEEEPIEMPSIDFGSGYTAAEIAKMRKEQEKKIKEQDLKAKMAEAEYKIMQRELSDGNIYADFDGEVVSLLTEEESREQSQPMVKVSGGGGFYITGSVSELEKDNLQIGQEVTVNDWSSGGSYTGTVESIGDFPSSSESWNGMGNPNATYYPFTAFVSGDANLQSGSYVSVQYSTSGSTSGIYLTKAFVRTEKGESYVFILGDDGRLEKRTVVTGKSLWGSYLEVLSGVSSEDKFAFPYGKNVKDGAKAAEGDISNLYGY